MKQVSEYKVNYVTNEFGEIDVNYYISKAHQLRSEEIERQAKLLGERIKQSVASATAVFSTPKTA